MKKNRITAAAAVLCLIAAGCGTSDGPTLPARVTTAAEESTGEDLEPETETETAAVPETEEFSEADDGAADPAGTDTAAATAADAAATAADTTAATAAATAADPTAATAASEATAAPADGVAL